MEGLFDDFDDEILHSSEDDSEISQQIIECEDKPKIKKWLLEHILCTYGTPFKCEEGKDIEFFMDGGELYCDIKINSLSTTFTDEIPDYVKINKLDCRTVMFNFLTNLPREIDGTLHIYKSKLKDFSDIRFPQKIGELNLVDSKLSSLTGLNDYCKHIDQLNLERCDMFKSFDGIPEEIKSIKLLKCNKIKNLIGIPESVDFLELFVLKSFESLEGCPRKLHNGLYILDCPQLSSLANIADLIIGDVEVQDCLLYQLDMTNCRITGDFKLKNNQLNDLENGPKQIDGSYIIEDKYLSKLNASGTTMTNQYNNAKFIYKVRRNYFKEDKNFPQMSNSVKIEKEYIKRE